MKNKKLLILVLIGVVFLAAMILPRLLKKEAPIEAVPPVYVNVGQPVEENIYLTTSFSGSIEPLDMVTVIPQIPGEVTEVAVKVGDTVSEGQILFKIDTKQTEGAKIALEGAKITLDDAKANLAKMDILYQSGDISAQAYDQVKSAVKGAQLQYNSAKLAYDTQMNSSVIKAPISGVIESVNAQVHDLVGQNYLCIISGAGGKQVSFSVPERVKEHLKVGDTISLEKSGSQYQGVITEVGSMVDLSSGLFPVKGTIENGESLATGTSMKLNVISNRAEGVMAIPVDSVFYTGGDPYVYLYKDGVVSKSFIEVGIYNEETIQVISGLNKEDQVITSWSSNLYEGAKVMIRDEESQEVEKGE